MIIGWLLLFMMAPPQGTTGAKICIFCEPTDSSNCPGFPMTCGDHEECFVGHGTAPGFSPVINKGCTQPTSCGREESITYQSVNYSFISTCCYGQLCNRAPTPSGSMIVWATISLLLGVLLLH
ncbi:sperm acrosome membrane-associated protein 4-like [Molossus molossus]|uniref:Sperm acrosome associated 4 n=1 Tax=Molossus molossus TaxID=27622 RepID=A0A7J8J9L0_MOLMO|nr:sperm acrosome membrane-associated protein 4-like [Molossus molossus]KAF6493035.1 sperm acrosome associated 4 [Molossus molossus]